MNESEALFESFCTTNRLDWSRVPTGTEKTPDYKLQFGNHVVFVEIEQIEALTGFNPSGVSSRTVGSHVRHKINEARAQIKVAARDNPAILLIYNAVDPLQLFGTESHDFICAMYGELTVRIASTQTQSFHGRNAKLRYDENVSFSGVGHLKRVANGAEVTIIENVYASRPLPFDALPACLKAVHVEVEHAA